MTTPRLVHALTVACNYRCWRLMRCAFLPISISLAAILLRGANPLSAQTNDAPALPLLEVAPGIFQIGKVRLNKQDRTVAFPVVVNMRTGAVEYLLVHKNGKTHESILRTDAEPYHIHVAMLLLGARGRGTRAFPTDKQQPPPGDPTRITLSWTNHAVRTLLPAEHLVINRATGKPLQELDWIYNGSLIDADGFAAQQTGSIVSLIDDPDALLNNPLPQRDDDDNWRIAVERLKSVAAPAELILSFPNAETPLR